MQCGITVRPLCINVGEAVAVSEFCVLCYKKSGKAVLQFICLGFTLATYSHRPISLHWGSTGSKSDSREALTESTDLLGCTQLLLFGRRSLSASFIYVFPDKPIFLTLFVFIPLIS